MDRPLPNLSSFPFPAQAWLRAYLCALDSEPPLSARSRADLAELTLRQYAEARFARGTWAGATGTEFGGNGVGISPLNLTTYVIFGGNHTFET